MATDRKLRTSSLEALTTFLASRRSLPDADARKLWTGLYYALWMTDRPKPQQALAADLASLLFALRGGGGRCAGPWLRAFWHVLGAQWTGIEALRLDKFLLLVRRVFAAMLRYATTTSSSSDDDDGDKTKKKKKTTTTGNDDSQAGRAAVVLDVCREYVFDGQGGPSGLGVLPLGLRLHVLDLWVDELDRAGLLPPSGDDDGDAPNQHEAFVREMGDMVEALRTNGNKAVRERARESYEDERLPWGTKTDPMDEDSDEAPQDEDEEDDDDEDEDGWGGIED
ncbi:hypothetical protein V2A60_004112 [Cordyceps javanica]